MKKMLIMSSLVFGSVLHSIAADTNTGATKKSGETKTVAKKTASKSLSATQRADYLTNQMIRDLKLNNYQARKLRAINLDKVNRMMEIEAKGGDPNMVDMECKGVCKERDQELENILSTEQYSDYFGNRPDYYEMDKDYASGGFLNEGSAKANTNKFDNNDDDASADTQQYASR